MTALRRHRALDAIWRSERGWRRPFTTVNHTDLGRMFLVTSFVFFLVGGVLAMLIRAQLATPHSAFAGPEVYNQIFTMHGTIMMFLFAIPTFEGLAVYLLPKMLGTRDLAFPRLSAYGYWCYAFGGTMMLVSLVLGVAPDGGWFMYPPLTGALASPGINTDVWLIGITFVEVSAISAAVELTVSILKYRAPGMSLDKMPIFAWYALVTALMILTGFPPLILGSILLELERAFGLPFFQADAGGDSLLWQHLFWLFGHPEVYIIFLPAAGVISTVLPVMCRTTLLGYGWIVASAVALAFLSFGLWVHHMFATGIPHMGLAFFSAASTLVAVPTGVQVFAWIGTMWKGRPELHLPMLHLLGFFVTFVIGGLTGVMVAVVPFDWQAHDTAFVTAHLHYVLFGGFVFPMFAALYYWLPHVSGRKRFFRIGEVAFALIFVGFHVTFLAMHWVGLLGQRRRISTYAPEDGWTTINLVSSVGSFVLAIGIAVLLVDVVLNFAVAFRGRRNPWRAGTLEWAMTTPPPAYNFASLPEVAGREPLADDPALATRLARGEGYLGTPRHGWRETLTVEVATGRPETHVVLPGNTALPIAMAAATGAFFLSLLLKAYWATPFAVVAVAALAVRWAWSTGCREDLGPQDVGRGVRLPTHTEVARSPGWWGSAFLLVADATLFGSLLFGFAFLWTIAPGWPPPAWLTPSAWEVALGVAGAVAGSVGVRMAMRGVASEAGGGPGAEAEAGAPDAGAGGGRGAADRVAGEGAAAERLAAERAAAGGATADRLLVEMPAAGSERNRDETAVAGANHRIPSADDVASGPFHSDHAEDVADEGSAGARRAVESRSARGPGAARHAVAHDAVASPLIRQARGHAGGAPHLDSDDASYVDGDGAAASAGSNDAVGSETGSSGASHSDGGAVTSTSGHGATSGHGVGHGLGVGSPGVGHAVHGGAQHTVGGGPLALTNGRGVGDGWKIGSVLDAHTSHAAQRREVLAAHVDAAGMGEVEPGDDPAERRLAGAGLADEGERPVNGGAIPSTDDRAAGPAGARRLEQSGQRDAGRGLLLALAGSLAVATSFAALVARAPTPDAHAYGATLVVLGGYGLFHAALAALMVGVVMVKRRAGLLSPARRAALPVVALWLDWLAAATLLALAAAHLPGALA